VLTDLSRSKPRYRHFIVVVEGKRLLATCLSTSCSRMSLEEWAELAPAPDPMKLSCSVSLCGMSRSRTVKPWNYNGSLHPQLLELLCGSLQLNQQTAAQNFLVWAELQIVLFTVLRPEKRRGLLDFEDPRFTLFILRLVLGSSTCLQQVIVLYVLPRANYTDRATAACRRSNCQLLRIEGATWSV
jgi:hypothetical protein